MHVKPTEKLFTKTVITKGYGFNTPQDGSVCKIKIIKDEANILTELDEEQVKVIIVGDVDEHIDRLLEDCIRTMKENEECSIEFLHPDAYAAIHKWTDNQGDKNEKNDTQDNCPENTEDGSTGNVEDDCIPNSEVQNESDVQMEDVKSTENEEKDISPGEPPESPTTDKEEINSNANDEKPNLVTIQFQLLSYTTEPEIWEMSVTEKWRRASYHKERGLELYARGNYEYAFRRFGLTLKYLISLEHDVPSGEEGMDIKGLKLSCYLNVAACQMRHHNFESVVKNASKALNLQPNNAKALYRRGSAYLELQEYEKAQEDLMAAQELEPKNKAIARQLQILKSRVQKLNQYYASAMKKMFS